jgi:hypothetical protein
VTANSLNSEVLALIERYRAGVGAVEAALANASDAELDARDNGEWSARMVAHHMADSETNSYVRLRRLLAEEPPVAIAGYDESRWAATAQLGYESAPIEPSLAVFRAVRAASAEVLERLSAEDFARTGVHSESGAYSVRDWLEIYAAHAEEHAQQIARARASGSGGRQ